LKVKSANGAGSPAQTGPTAITHAKAARMHRILVCLFACLFLSLGLVWQKPGRLARISGG
jgi:hypothetical protein